MEAAIWTLVIAAFTIFVGVILISIPATLSLPPGPRPGVEPLTLEQAIQRIESTTGGELARIEQARRLVITRMAYCRRNSFDSYETAFERGYGYCIQQAQALVGILQGLKLKAFMVQATKNRFQNGKIGGHAWVRVESNGATKDMDPTYDNLADDRLTFVPLSEVTRLDGVFLGIALWGSTSVNAVRYYLTKSDTS